MFILVEILYYTIYNKVQTLWFCNSRSSYDEQSWSLGGKLQYKLENVC